MPIRLAAARDRLISTGFGEGTAIVDAHDDLAAGACVGDADLAAKGQGGVCGGHGVHVRTARHWRCGDRESVCRNSWRDRSR